MWKAVINPSIRTRRLATSSFFIATFAASILTVSLSASTILPCPANSRSSSRGTLSDDSSPQQPHPDHGEEEKLRGPGPGIGQKVVLTKKGGWIEIDHPLLPHQQQHQLKSTQPVPSTKE